MSYRLPNSTVDWLEKFEGRIEQIIAEHKKHSSYDQFQCG